MSTQITTAFVQQFNANIFHLSQQKGSRLASLVRNETQKGESQFWDRLGQVNAVKKTGRHTPTPRLDTPHSRRMVTLVDYEWADLIDDQDKIRMLNDPTSEYAQAAMWALGRGKDDEIIAAAIGNAYSGQKGDVAVPLSVSQRIASISAGTTIDGLNINALILAKEKFGVADVDPDEELYFVVNQKMVSSLLKTTQVTNSDYNSVKALVEGKIDTFMGFKFIRTERLLRPQVAFSFDTDGNGVASGGTTVTLTQARSGIAFAKSGLLLASGLGIVTKIDELPTLSYSTQVYARGSYGATRMEEAKVVEIVVKE